MTTLALPNGTPPKPRQKPGEHVAAAGGYQRTMPVLTIDDLTRDYGDAEYSAMCNDAVVAANLNLYAAGVVSDDPQFAPAVTDKATPGYRQAAKLVDWLEAQIEQMDIPLHAILFDMQRTALAYGCKLAEVVTGRDSTFSGRTQVVLQGIRPLRRDVARLQIDPFDTVVAIDAPVYDPATGKVRRGILPRENFLLVTNRIADNDPRGTNILRPAYTAWDLKMKTWPEYYKYLVQFASPSVWGTAAENAPDEVDANGNPVTAVQALLLQLMAFQNGSALAMPYGAEVGTLVSTGEGKAFLSAFETFNREITTAMLTATRATMEAQHGSKADSGTASDVLDVFLRQSRYVLERAIYTQVLRPLVRRNYGDKVAQLTPYLSLGGVTEEDVYTLSSAVAALYSAGYLDPSQLPELDARLKLAARTADELAARANAKAAGQNAVIQADPQQQQDTPPDDNPPQPQPDRNDPQDAG